MRKFLSILILIASTTGCHTVDFDPPAQMASVAPISTPYQITWVIPPDVLAEDFSMRSAWTGIANKWTVPIGEVLHQYTQSLVAPRFYGSVVSNYDPGQGRVLTIRITHYLVDSRDHHAEIGLRVEDRAHTGFVEYRDFSGSSDKRMAMGVLGAKGAIRKSTDAALRAALDGLAFWIASRH